MSTLSSSLKDLALHEVLPSRNQRRVVGLLGFAVATALSSYVLLPLPWTPVPMTLQPMVVLLAGLVLGPWLGAASMASYLAMGMAGLPVFSGGGAGALWLLGPTGGYLIAYPAVAFVAGRLAGGEGAGVLRLAGAALAGLLVLYAGGVSQLLILTGSGLGQALALGVLPFVLGDLIKVVAAVAVARRVRTRSLRLF